MQNTIRNINNKLIKNMKEQQVLNITTEKKLPSQNMVADLIMDFQRLFFPGYFGRENMELVPIESFTADRLANIYEKLVEITNRAIFSNCFDCEKRTKCTKVQTISMKLMEEIPNIYNIVLTDIDAAYEGDPASSNKTEIVSAYPGFYAIFIYRIAHKLYELQLPIVPRLMTEYAHQKTGIDINPGAKIGKAFFIDHGTGVVIGETTTIGDHVRLYQGVTLGALSLSDPRSLCGKKRHPSIGSNVIIYANTTILGGDTKIPDNACINGNTFITKSPTFDEPYMNHITK